MKKFSDLKKVTKINETEITLTPDVEETTTLANLPENIEDNQLENTDKIKDDESVDVSKFFSKLFESREMSHIYHLQVNGDGGHAKHMALGDYYEGVLDFIDSIIETYQGQYGIIEGYDMIDTSETKTKDPIAYLEEVAEYIKHGRKCINDEDTHLHNIVDEIVALIYRTLYKLKFTK